jgi:DNA-binding transcriptional LysR family regulator
MNMNLRDIQYFAVVAEHRHLGRAAEALGLSQPALSMSVRRLENHLRTKLVKRTPKGVDLTHSGEALFAHARRLRLSVDDISREVADLSRGQAGHLNIGTGPGFSFHLLPEASKVLAKDAPKVTLKVVVKGRGDSLVELRAGKLDLVIAAVRAADDVDLVQEHLYDDESVVFASVNHRLAKRKRLTLADLAEERWALTTDDTPTWNRLHQVFESNGLPRPRVTIETSSIALRLPLIASSDLLGYSSRPVVQRAAPHLRFAELKLKELAYTRHVGVIYRRDAYLSPAAHRFIEILKTTAKEIATEKP